MSFTHEQLLEMYRQLPQKVQDAIFSDQTAKTMQMIGEEYKLHIDQVGIIADEAGLVMLGVSPRSRFAQNIQTKAQIQQEIAASVAAQVETRVFKPIQEHLKSATTEEEVMDTLPSYEAKMAATSKLPQYEAPKTKTQPNNSATLTPQNPLTAKTKEQPTLPEKPSLSTVNTPTIPEIQTQNPISVITPKDGATPVTSPNPTKQFPETPKQPVPDIISSKLGGVVYEKTQTTTPTQTPTPSSPKPSTPLYSTDPYREPI